RPSWLGAESLSMAAAASVIQMSHVFRGREQLLRRLDRIVADEKGHTVKAQRARLARDLAALVFSTLDPLDRSRTFAEQVDRLLHVVKEFRIGGSDEGGLDVLWDALEDQADVLDRLGRGNTKWSWSAFVREVESLVVELKSPGPTPPPGSVRMMT